MTISIDLDGVCVGGSFVEEWNRKPNLYAEQLPIEGACNNVWHLANNHKIYYLSSRKFQNAAQISIDWLRQHNFPFGSGVIVGVPSNEKRAVARSLGVRYHIDDNPNIITDMLLSRMAYGNDPQGLLFVGREVNGWWPGTQEWIDGGRLYFSEWREMVKWIEGAAL